jgi:hypothetical protein
MTSPHEARVQEGQRAGRTVPVNEERAAEGVDHLQAAALEMIEAARAFLDVAEQVVSDRDRVAEAFSVMTDVARAAAKKAERPTDDPSEDHHVQRITLSS